jgi:hypothetical protein
MWFSPVTAEKYGDSTLNQVTLTSFHILVFIYSLIIQSVNAIELATDSMVK